VPVVFGKIGSAVPKEFIEDRRKLMGGGDFGAFIAAAPLFGEQLRAHARLLEAQLGDGRRFLLGEEPSLAEFARISGGLSEGERVAVVPDDYGFDPVEGVAADIYEIALRRSSPETGEVVVHFPRAGFRVTRPARS